MQALEKVQILGEKKLFCTVLFYVTVAGHDRHENDSGIWL